MKIGVGSSSGFSTVVLRCSSGLFAAGFQDALDLIHKAVAGVKSKPWDSESVPSELARMGEEGETTDAIDQLFKTPADKSRQLIEAATVFMSEGNTAAAVRLVSKVEPDKVMPGDTVPALKLYAQLDNVAAVAAILSRSVVSCDELAQLGEVFLNRNAKDRVRDIEQLMIANARAVPLRSRVAECLLDASLLQSSSGDNTNGSKSFAAATELIGQIPNKDGFRANLSGLAAEVALRSPLDRARISQWLSNAESDTDKLPPLPAFGILIRLADVALLMGDKDDLRTILKTAEDAIGRDTEYQSRSPKYRRLAERYSEAGWYRNARLIAERSVIGDERLKAFAAIVWKIRGRDTPLLRPLLGLTKDGQGDFVLTDLNPNEQKRADKEDRRQLLRIGLGPVCPSECSTVH